MVQKLNIGATFLRWLLYARRTTIGVGLLQPHGIVAVAILKQYIGNTRIIRNVEQIIVTTKELIAIKIGYGRQCIDVDPD